VTTDIRTQELVLWIERIGRDLVPACSKNDARSMTGREERADRNPNSRGRPDETPRRTPWKGAKAPERGLLSDEMMEEAR